MELKQLYYFITVVREGTISAAARKLNLSQPPLSTQMKQLEEEFGCILFERGSRKIQLTEAGELLYGRALTLLELSDVTRQEMLDYRNGTTGALRLGVISSVGSSLLPEWISVFHREFPNIHFELTEANTYQLLDLLRANLVELAIIRTPFQGENLEICPLCEEPMLAVGHASFFAPAPEKDSLELAALNRLPLIVYRRWEQTLQEVFDQDHLTLSVFCRNDDARTTAIWADAGLGVGIIPSSSRTLVRNPETKVYKIDDGRLGSRILIVHNKNAYLSTIARMFLHCLQQFCTLQT